jgi:nicotinamide mononucleotide transporter
MSPFEVIGTVFGLLSVWLTARASIWCWPTGIVNIVCFAVVFTQALLYPELITYAMFLVLSVYGWWVWARGGPRRRAAAVRRAARGTVLGCAALVALGGPALGAAFAHFTDAALPHLDATIAVASVVAQTLLARKLVESWWFWIFVDVVAVPVYLARGLVLPAALYVVFLALAIRGLASWSRRAVDYNEAA